MPHAIWHQNESRYALDKNGHNRGIVSSHDDIMVCDLTQEDHDANLVNL